MQFKMLCNGQAISCRLLSTKMLLVMKLTFFMLTAFFLHLHATVRSQNVSFAGRAVPLEQIFSEVRKQTGYVFFYDVSTLRDTRPVSIAVKDMPLKDFMDYLLKDQPLSFSIRKHSVFIRKEERPRAFYLETVSPVKGLIMTAGTNRPLVGATIMVKRTRLVTFSDQQGRFSIDARRGDILVITYVGFKSREVEISGDDAGVLVLEPETAKLEEVSVVSTGYQQLPKERVTGSFAQIDRKLFDRQVSTDILSRLNGIAPSLLFDERSQYGRAKINIRGLSTIMANDQPLIVVDNFPFNGDINSINPNDVESITILRDAAAASIWGVRAGNGVIVITTRKGSNRTPKVNVTSNVTLGEQRDLYYIPRITTSDFIDFERFLFDKGHYNVNYNDANYTPLTPVVKLLFRVRNGEITQAEADAQINAFRTRDIRSDLQRYFYRNALNQQYAVNVSGGMDKYNYYLSAGFDRNLDETVGNSLNRITLNSRQTFTVGKRLHIDATLWYSQNKEIQNNVASDLREGYKSLHPYARLVDEAGNPLPIQYRFDERFQDIARSQGFLNWEYVPLDELALSDNSTRFANLRAAATVRYDIARGLSLNLMYQYESQQTLGRSFYSAESFFARNVVNEFSKFDGTKVTGYNVAPGGIITLTNHELVGHNGRLQLNYDRTWNDHQLIVLGGFEARQVQTEAYGRRMYGYDPVLGSSVPVDFLNGFPTNPLGTYLSIPDYGNELSGTIDRDRSYYLNQSYTYKRRYTLSANARIDQSNLFGVNSNQRSSPLWHVGGKWDISSEPFYRSGLFPMLSLRTSFGYNGNVDRNVTALTTARFATAAYSQRNAAVLVNPPNSDLRWERSAQLNFGLDFSTRNNAVSGTVEYYRKKGTDLMGYAPLDPTNGMLSMKGNVASMRGMGWDVQLRTLNLNRRLRWTSVFNFSYAADVVTEYLVKENSISYYTIDASVNRFDVYPLTGRPVYGIYSVPFAGLDPQTGATRGYLNGVPSTDFNAILSATTVDSLVYAGRALAPFYGSLMNTFELGPLSLSFNIAFRFGHYYKRGQFLNYFTLYEQSTAHGDYAKRWQKPGDELKTDVPAITYPYDGTQDAFHTWSTVLVDKGDIVRLRDVNLSYELLNNTGNKRLPLQRLQVTGYVNNIGVLWRANRFGEDPDHPNVRPTRTYTIGLRADF